MHLPIVATLIWLLLALLTTACDKTPKIAPLPANAVVLAFGDSLTHGNGAAPGEAYPEVLAGLLGRTVINAGVPGEISAAGLSRLPQLLEQYRPNLVILCHGGNDFLQRLDRARTAANLAAMIEQIRATGADVVLVGVPEFGLILSPPDFYGEMARRFAIPYEEEIVSDLLGDRDFKSDNIHPNAAGYRRMAEAIFKLIKGAHGV
ncbi:MAG: arylesterase [Desulfuromonadales bacterium]|nr:arylesterase [Desulfuromonadales bacterium]